MSCIVLCLHFTVFYSGVVSCFLSSFIIRHACICDGHLLQEAKSFKVLFTKAVLKHVSLNNGRIDVHPPRDLSRNLSGNLGSRRPLKSPKRKHRKKNCRLFTEINFCSAQKINKQIKKAKQYKRKQFENCRV